MVESLTHLVFTQIPATETISQCLEPAVTVAAEDQAVSP
jgi:hypothetical protein